MSDRRSFAPPGGLTPAQAATIRSVIGADARTSRILLFGSRAKGTHREGSDIDLAVAGTGLNRDDAARWAEELEEALFPWSVDVVLLDDETAPALRAHIERVGQELGHPCD